MTTKEFDGLTAGDGVELEVGRGKPNFAAIVLKTTTRGVKVRWQDGQETTLPRSVAGILHPAPRPAGPCAVGKDKLPEDPDGGMA